MMTLLLAALVAASGNGDYAARAYEASAAIQRAFWDEGEGLYHPDSPSKPGTLPYDFMWGNGVQFSALVAAARHDPEVFRPVMERFFTGLDRYWDAAAPIPGYDAYFSSPTADDKYYDDNAWMVLTFCEAYTLTQDPRYLQRAEETMRYVLSGWDEQLGGGIYWRQDHKSKNTCSNAPAAAAALALAQFGNRERYVAWAKRIVTWTNAHLQSPEGPFWDSLHLDGRVERTKWTYNTALMIRANLGLFRETREARYLEEAQRLARASEAEFVNPDTGAFRDDALFSHLLVEAYLDLYRETHEPYLLERARRNADFVLKHVRDPAGGYWRQWKILPERKEERKTLIANASVARMLWLVAEAGQ